MRIRSGFLAFWFSGLALLTGCDLPVNEPQAMVTAAPQPADNRPVIVPAGIDVIPLISQAGAPWDGEAFFDHSSYNAGVDLLRREVSFKHGSISVDRANAGGIYMIQVRTGKHGDCGSAAPLEKALSALSSGLNTATLTADQIGELKRAWSSADGWADIEVTGLKFHAGGGCVPTLLLKANS